MTTRAGGTFDVKLSAQELHDAGVATTLLGMSRMSLAKRFHGDLEGTSVGEMLAAGTATKGSAGYVAIERVEGTLHGRKGSFVLQHSGTMNRGAPTLSVTVVPDSGTEELAGLAGKLDIDIVESKHFYTFDYTLDENNA